jgi:ComF family protein
VHDLCAAYFCKSRALQCLAAVSYGYPWSRVVQQFKFHGQSAWARTLSQLLLAAPGVETAVEAADVLIPMPLSRARLRERGFNQSALLAEALAPARARNGVLLRITDTAAQSGLGRRARMENVQSAFAVEPAQYAALKGRHAVLVDDVMTSGASMYACTRVLRQAGAARVTGVVFARTPADDEPPQ